MCKTGHCSSVRLRRIKSITVCKSVMISATCYRSESLQSEYQCVWGWENVCEHLWMCVCVHMAESPPLNFKGCSGISARMVGTENRSLNHTQQSRHTSMMNPELHEAQMKTNTILKNKNEVDLSYTWSPVFVVVRVYCTLGVTCQWNAACLCFFLRNEFVWWTRPSHWYCNSSYVKASHH